MLARLGRMIRAVTAGLPDLLAARGGQVLRTRSGNGLSWR